jgi:hypothetical protein
MNQTKYQQRMPEDLILDSLAHSYNSMDQKAPRFQEQPFHHIAGFLEMEQHL